MNNYYEFSIDIKLKERNGNAEIVTLIQEYFIASCSPPTISNGHLLNTSMEFFSVADMVAYTCAPGFEPASNSEARATCVQLLDTAALIPEPTCLREFA